MGHYDSAIDLADRLITGAGEVSSLIRSQGDVAFDPSMPWKPGPATIETYSVETVYLNTSILRRDALVKQGESFVIMAAKGMTVTPDPTTDHLLRADGITRYAILSVEPLAPNGQTIIYEIKVRA